MKKFNQTKLEERLEATKTFKELILYLYETFPNGALIEDEVRKIIVAEQVRDSLEESHFLIKELTMNNGKKEYRYSLGPSSLALVSSWKSERLTKKIKELTYWMIGLTILNITLVLIQVLK